MLTVGDDDGPVGIGAGRSRLVEATKWASIRWRDPWPRRGPRSAGRVYHSRCRGVGSWRVARR